MSPGERLLGLDLANGGHLTHGMKLNFSGNVYESGFYGVGAATGLVDMDAVLARALEVPASRAHRGVVGLSAHPRLRGLPVDCRRSGRAPGGPMCTWCSAVRGSSSLDGKAAEDLLHEIGITVNRNAVPNDPRPPMVTSGLRMADVVALRDRFTRLAREFPLYEGLKEWELHGR